MTKINDYTIRFHNKILWKWEYLVHAMMTRGYIWNIDFWGYKNAQDAPHMGFISKEVKDIAQKLLKRI